MITFVSNHKNLRHNFQLEGSQTSNVVRIRLSHSETMASEAETKSPLEDTSALQDQLDELNAQITKQGSHVRQLKKDGAADNISDAVNNLQALKIQAAELAKKLEADAPTFNRKAFDDLILRKMFIVPSFDDLGPPACSLKVSYT
jgi:SMC interacting uncharacterized protein involved in chromosome segregation